MEGRADPLKGPTNHESASEAEENVGHAAEFVTKRHASHVACQ